MAFFLRREDYKESMLQVLDSYCESILGMIREPRYLAGGALAMRKSLELIGMTMQLHFAKERANFKISGEEVFDGRNAHCLAAGKLNVDEDLVGKIFDIRNAVSATLHYQGYRYAEGALEKGSDDARRLDNAREELRRITKIEDYAMGSSSLEETEKKSLLYDYRIVDSQLAPFANVLRHFLEHYVEIDENQKNRYARLSRLAFSPEGENGEKSDSDFRFVTWNIDEILREINGRFQPAPVGQSPSFLYYTYACEALNLCRGIHTLNERYNSLLQFDTAVVWNRKIAEKTAYIHLAEKRNAGLQKDGEACRKNDAKLSAGAGMLEAYCDNLRKTVKDLEHEARQEILDLITDLDLVNKKTSYWMHVKPDTAEILRFEERTRGKANDVMIERVDPLCSDFIRNAILDEQSDAIQEWINRNSNNLKALRESLEEEKRRNRRLRIAIGVLTALLVCGVLAVCGWVGYRAYRTAHEETGFYADAVWQGGVPQGVFALEQAEGTEHYELVTRGGKVVRLTHVDAQGRPANETLSARLDRAAQAEILYNGDTPYMAVFSDAEGRRIYAQQYSPDLSVVNIVDPVNLSAAYPLPADVTRIDVGEWAALAQSGDENEQLFSEITAAQLEWVDDRTLLVYFRDGDREFKDVNGVTGLRVEFDSLGRPETVRYNYERTFSEDPAGSPVRRLNLRRYIYDQDQLHRTEDVYSDGERQIVEYAYDEATNRCVREEMLSASEERRARSDGVSIIEYAYDPQAGSLAEIRYLNAQEGLTLSEDGYAVMRIAYDGQGRVILEELCGADGNPAAGREGWARRERTFSEDGTTETVSTYDAQLNLIVSAAGYAQIRTVTSGETKTVARLDAQGSIVPFADGTCQRRETYDGDGRLVKTESLDEAGELMCNAYGYSSRSIAYRSNTQQISEERYLDADGAPCMRVGENGLTYAIVRYGYNTKGQRNRYDYLDTQEKPIPGVSVIEKEYDEFGRLCATDYLDQAENLTVNDLVGCARVEQSVEKTQTGSLKTVSYCGTDGRLMINPMRSYARLEEDFDGQGRETERRLYGADGELMVAPQTGYARMTRHYDANGNETGWEFYDAGGNLIFVNKWGYAAVKNDYDEQGRLLGYSFYGADGNPALNPEQGCARREMDYDAQGHKTEYRYYGTDGKLMINPQMGYARLTSHFDANGNEVGWELYDADGNLSFANKLGYAAVESDYDEQGHMTERRYYGTDGELTVNPVLGYARITRHYNASGMETAWETYDASGNLIFVERNGCAAAENDYDEQGRLLGYRFYGADGKPVFNPQYGCAEVKISYDAQGNQIVEQYDEDGNLIEAPQESGAQPDGEDAA